ncbi:hypothetical protein DM01DRAFT_1205775 [Hesseltinella vesiculosa]|uniref:Uncharacterized protein n=1 Tax=Hesseltinella vesiculosa TaxID=101127 RepID=A0A1X2GR22_9FUNG|nr:hypothetical protein DM01DRAFT_1205775 [Hesseltinella vesiculosa]
MATENRFLAIKESTSIAATESGTTKILWSRFMFTPQIWFELHDSVAHTPPSLLTSTIIISYREPIGRLFSTPPFHHTSTVTSVHGNIISINHESSLSPPLLDVAVSYQSPVIASLAHPRPRYRQIIFLAG